MSMRELWAYTQNDSQNESEPSPTDAETPADSSLPRNIVAKVFFVVLAALVWVGYTVGKVLFFAAVVVLFFVISVIELVLELVVMPITLTLRVLGMARWPVEIGCQGKHFGTRHAKDYAAAGELRDGLATQIEGGDLPSRQHPSAA